MKNYKIIEGDCIQSIQNLKQKGTKVQGVITSPPYNTSRVSGGLMSERYGMYQDQKEDTEYREWLVSLFKEIDTILDKNGVIIWNQSYGVERVGQAQNMWLLIAEIIKETNFVVADKIAWKKPIAMPVVSSMQSCTRIVEDVFVFVREQEFDSYTTNKKVIATSEKGQDYYSVMYNFLTAKNNNQGEHTKIHGATYSTEFCDKIIKMYFPKGTGNTILDPFNGSGTTGISALQNGLNYIGLELDPKYCEISEERLSSVQLKVDSQLDDSWNTKEKEKLLV